MADKWKILIVDDDPNLRHLLVDTLSALGYAPVSATDGADALARLREQDSLQFDLLITDIKMPNMDGLMLLKKIRRTYPSLPVLFITGIVSEETMAAASPDGYLSKPFRISRLEELINNALASKRPGYRPPPPRRVLINVAEDSLRENLSDAMSFSNYLPFAVAGGDEALEELERGKFDAVIASIESVSSEGNQYLDRFRETYPDLPLVLTSATCSLTEIERLNDNLQANGCLGHAFRPGDLIELLDQTIRSTGSDPNHN